MPTRSRRSDMRSYSLQTNLGTIDKLTKDDLRALQDVIGMLLGIGDSWQGCPFGLKGKAVVWNTACPHYDSGTESEILGYLAREE
jgi:hypothetical protein